MNRSIRVQESQRGNALLKYLRAPRSRVVFAPCAYDIEPGSFFGVLYLSFRFHLANPGYIYKRIEEVKAQKSTRHAVVLLLVDTEINTKSSVGAFAKMQVECLGAAVQVMTSYSAAESAKYVEEMHADAGALRDRFRNYAHAVRKQKQELDRAEVEYGDISEYVRKTLFFTSVPSLTQRDAALLIPSFASVREAVQSMSAQRVEIKGIGAAKHEAFRAFVHAPFK